MNSPAYRAFPLPYGQRELVQDVFAYGTRPGRGVESRRLDKHCSELRRRVFEDADELRMTQIAHFATPSHLHRLNIQIFYADGVVGFAKPAGELELPVFALVCDMQMKSRKVLPRPPAVVRPSFLVRQFPVRAFHCAGVLPEKERRDNVVSVRRCEECFKTEIEPRALTRQSAMYGLVSTVAGKIDIYVSQRVALYRYRFHCSFDFARLVVLVLLFAYQQFVARQEFPPCFLL